ncbi:NAD(P)-binding protein [Aspergillus pseudoustus]|uniref:NAD(P)-binding protein n=1 Tax=Aspergillus pseudoustus TaxID=1810923 RepID=A0ABR4IYB6_9EURO
MSESNPATPYAHLHATPSGPDDARPTALQIIADENLTNALPGTTIVLTGATSGIGLETARGLATTGATLILPVRDIDAARQSVLGSLVREHGGESGRICLVQMDIASLSSIKCAASEVLSASGGKVDVLIANAGVMGLPEKTLSEDGYEMHFAVNYLGHFYLFLLLKDALLSAAAASPGGKKKSSRVVVVSSSAQRAGILHLPDGYDYNFTRSEYRYDAAYANSKLAAVYLANGIERVYGARGLHATSLHPGAIDTGISRHVGRDFVKAIMSNEAVARVVKSPAQGAATTVWAAVGREWADRGGKYLENCGEAKEGVDDGGVFATGWVPRTYDRVAEERLWREMCALLGVEEE